MINNTVLVDRLTRDPDLRIAGSRISVTTFILTVSRQYIDSQGERGADFVSCIVQRRAAENLANFASKGSLVGIQGRIQARAYDGENDRGVYVTGVVVDNFPLLESRRDHENRQTNGGDFASQGGNAPSTNSFSGSNVPSINNAPAGGESNKPQNPFVDSNSIIDISDDDLPF